MKSSIENAISQKNVDEAEKLIREYETEIPKDFDLYSYKVAVYLLKEEVQEAYSIAEKAVKKNPFEVEAEYNLLYCARLTGQHLTAYKALLMVRFLQKEFHLSIAPEEELQQAEAELRKIRENNPGLQDEFAFIEENHKNAIQDPFKNYKKDVAGSIFRFYNRKRYYVGLEENWFEAYHDINGKKDPIHARCELFPVEKIGTEFEVKSELGKVLVPVCLNYDKSRETDNFILDAEKRRDKYYFESAREKYSYIPVEGGARLVTGYPAVFGTPIPLSHKETRGRRRLVLNIFIDSLGECLMKEMGMENVMPETCRYFSKGTVCENFYSGSEWTLPSIPTYWTGKHPGKHMNLLEQYRFDFMGEQKVLAEYFHDAGYVTAKIGGNDGVTPFQGYVRGIDRFVYQYITQGYKHKEVVSDVLQHLETFRDTCQYVWADFVDLHDVSGGFMRSINVQSKLPLEFRHIDNDIYSTTKQTHSENRKKIFAEELREMDFFFGELYRYIEANYSEDEVLVSLFADHGSGFMVGDEEPFMSYRRTNVPLMLRGGDVPQGKCEEIIESTDYGAIMCKLAGIPYDYSGTDANLPRYFGGEKERELALSQNIFVGDPYRAALHGKDFHYYIESELPVRPGLRIDLDGRQGYILDNEGRALDDPYILEKCNRLIEEEIGHLIIYRD